MSVKTYQHLPIKKLIELQRTTEAGLARECELSRLTIRALIQGSESVQLNSVASAAKGLERTAVIFLQSSEANCDYSAQAASFRVLRDGDESWKLHFFDFVDEFRRTLDGRLILLPPASELSLKLKALLASMVCYLCREAKVNAPGWANVSYRLDQPWFVSESEALKPMMILETPLEFRKNLIFVGENILDRA